MAGGGFCMELSDGPKNRGLVEQPAACYRAVLKMPVCAVGAEDVWQ